MSVGIAAVAFAQTPVLESASEQLGYSIGYQVGSDFRRQAVELDPDLVVMGAMDALSGAEPALGDEEMRRALAELRTRAAQSVIDRRYAEAEANLAQSRVYLADNAKRAEVVTLPSGVQYQVLQPGSGLNPEADTRVRVHYQGTLLDGTVFDSSYQRSEPSNFYLASTIPAWREILPLMKEGAKWRIVVPPDRGYGEQGVRGEIPPNALLLFDIELINARVE